MFEREIAQGRPVYWYQGPPPPIQLDGMVVHQRGRMFCVMAAPAVDIDRLCRVPTIPYSAANSEIAAEAQAATALRWQRELDLDRVAEIGEFFARADSFLVNAAAVGLPSTVAMRVEGNHASCEIACTWPVRECPDCGFSPGDDHPHVGWSFDCCPRCGWDGRPGQIIDGQHRIRGCAGAPSPHNQETLVTAVLVDGVFSSADKAKVFTEITTSAVDLDALHKIFLLYKFGLRGLRIGDLGDADFRRLPPAPPSRNNLAMRNRRAYDMVCDLTSQDNSRWFERISMLPAEGGRQRRGDVMDSDTLVLYAEGWLAQDDILFDASQPDGMVDAATGSQYLRDFLEAALAVWPQGVGTPSGTSSWFWNNDRSQNGVLQLRGIFEVFLALFENSTRRILDNFGAPSLQAYKEEFSYLEHIRWDDAAWWGLATPDKNKDMLTRILLHAYQAAPYPIGTARVGSWVNTWIKQPPDPFEFKTLPSPTTTFVAASRTTPIRFEWHANSPFVPQKLPKPVNAEDTATILIEQQQGARRELLLQGETSQSVFLVDRPVPRLDTSPGSAMVTVTVVYKKGNDLTSKSFTHPAI